MHREIYPLRDAVCLLIRFRWPSYNWMGQILLGVFLIISHFIIM